MKGLKAYLDNFELMTYAYAFVNNYASETCEIIKTEGDNMIFPFVDTYLKWPSVSYTKSDSEWIKSKITYTRSGKPKKPQKLNLIKDAQDLSGNTCITAPTTK